MCMYSQLHLQMGNIAYKCIIYHDILFGVKILYLHYLVTTFNAEVASGSYHWCLVLIDNFSSGEFLNNYQI